MTKDFPGVHSTLVILTILAFVLDIQQFFGIGTLLLLSILFFFGQTLLLIHNSIIRDYCKGEKSSIR